MQPIDLDVTCAVRAWMAGYLDQGGFSLERVQDGLRDAAWYSARDRRTIRALCDAHPRRFTRWLYEHEPRGRYTGLLMVWPPRHATPIHDHAGLWGIEMVLQGTLAVDDYAFDPASRRLHFAGATVLGEGESCAFLGSPEHAHRCTNPSALRPAVTLHVYGGILDSYHSYSEIAGDHYVAERVQAPIDGYIGPVPDRMS
ncbi:hypothetical protein [Dokdonella sp.]|uniref:hypothetical protein n=1 Tax=Dokdonella sp. TaxID=2291710 RepID=UPI0031C1CE1C|nr:cysteine dioxygenase family protein [Dokdonella sp.]